MDKQADVKFMVLGASRGGTTLLAAALGAHPKVAMLDEDMSGAFDRVVGGKIAGVKLCVPNQIEFERRWNPLYAPGLLGGAMRKSLFMNRQPKSRLSIRDYDRFGPIRHIGIARHPAGVIPAIMKRENRGIAVASYRWQRCMNVFKALSGESAYKPVFVTFEDLVRQPEGTLKALCAALEIDFSAQMLEAPSRNDRYQSKGFDPVKAEYEDEEAIWTKLPAGAKVLYDEICANAVRPS